MYDASEGKLSVRLPFHYIGHFSRFVQPGAYRMLTTQYTSDLECCGFVNPDGSYALIILNRTDRDIGFDLTWESMRLGKHIAPLDAPAHSIQTLYW